MFTVLIYTLTLVSCNQFFGVFSQQYEDDPCPADQCVPVSLCSSALEEIKKGIHPKLCGFKDDDPLTCCEEFGPDVKDTEKDILIAAQMCEKYTSKVCPRVGIFVVGGKEAKPKELPFMAHIGYGEDGGDIAWQCGGSLVSPRYVLSAAHCTDASNLGRASWVRLGELDISSDNDDAQPEILKIVLIHDHPRYRPPQVYNDIALYRLERDVEFNEYIRPICLHSIDESRPQDTVLAAGWGRLGFVEKLSNKLMKVELNVMDPFKCSNTGGITEMPQGVDRDAMICAGSDMDDKDTCLGDSGGPLFSQPKSKFCHLRTQFGVTSFGYQCGLAEYPGVYTRVLYHLRWIESIVWPLNKTNSVAIWTD
ncbi:hypothetical protein LSTR_LSTR000324 [Laodelphax striatellus]|uniref:Peptidase S1 domain-containing protein n=1 Tax=Laodelphax striatellus TaxID=195883 RepID=A0A482X836_LAOST|nr:hypothetical protein LSTR_LSTR000324 [Laodelphax striatellus]